MNATPDELLVGALCLAVIAPWIAWTIWRGFSEGRLPVGRGYVDRAERPGPFRALLASYLLVILLMAFIGFDLLFGIRS